MDLGWTIEAHPSVDEAEAVVLVRVVADPYRPGDGVQVGAIGGEPHAAGGMTAPVAAWRSVIAAAGSATGLVAPGGG